MVAPLEGIKVLEVASWLAAPSCAALMADMGAEVIKVEPPSGDTYRNLYTAMLGEDFVHPCFQFDNRGKQGICINLEDEAGREALRTLIEQTDIFLTNLTSQGSLAMACSRATFSNSRRRPFTPSSLAMAPMAQTAIAKLSIKRLFGQGLEPCLLSGIAMTAH